MALLDLIGIFRGLQFALLVRDLGVDMIIFGKRDEAVGTHALGRVPPNSSARRVNGAGYLTQGGIESFDPARKGHTLTAYYDAVQIAPLLGIDGISVMDVLGM